MNLMNLWRGFFCCHARELPSRVNEMNKVNVVNVGERYKSITFTTYPSESKGLVNVVNVVRRYFASSRTRVAKLICQPRADDRGRKFTNGDRDNKSLCFSPCLRVAACPCRAPAIPVLDLLGGSAERSGVEWVVRFNFDLKLETRN